MILALLLACGSPEAPPTPAAAPAPAVSSTASGFHPREVPPRVKIDGHAAGADCASCHAAEATAWTGSHHQLATATVDVAAHAARFDGKPVTAGALTVTPARAGDTLTFTVKEAKGTHTWKVVNTLAVAPLQQYLLEADRGRLLVAPIAWDVGAGRWFDPSQEGAVGDPADPLYWAGITGTWNHMCAECHTTRLDEGFDAETQTYHTTYDQLGVGCVGCHGPAVENDLRDPAAQIQVCGDCHSRRESVAVRPRPGAPVLEHALPTLLDATVYTPLGGIRKGEEAFEYGSFLQSRMYEKGVTCSDCHDPHTGKLKAEGDAVCTSCHADPKYATPAHHGHQKGTFTCVNCHMETETYMGVHVRHDHQFRVPDPTTARALGVEDACSDCHRADGKLEGMPARDDAATKFAALAAAGRQRDPRVVPALHQAVANLGLGGFRRASAAALLAGYPPPPDATALTVAAKDADPLVREAVLATLGAWGMGAGELRAALRDDRRVVRFVAFRGVAFSGPGEGDAATTWLGVFEEMRRMTPHLDSPSSWANLAVLAAAKGDVATAEAELRTALRLAPDFTPARQNLAVLLAQQGRRDEAQRILDGK